MAPDRLLDTARCRCEMGRQVLALRRRANADIFPLFAVASLAFRKGAQYEAPAGREFVASLASLAVTGCMEDAIVGPRSRLGEEDVDRLRPSMVPTYY